MTLRATAALAAVLAGYAVHAAPVAPAAAARPSLARPAAAEPAAARALLGGYLAAPDAGFPERDPFDGRPLPAGDLDGDGGTDFGLARQTPWRGGPPGSVDVRRGATAELLWTAPLPGYLSFPVFTAVGPGGGRGLLVVSYDDVPAEQAPQPVAVRAYDAGGRAVWTFGGAAGARVHKSYYSPPGAYNTAGTVVYGVGNLVRGGGTDLLVGTLVSRAAPYGGDPTDDHAPWLMRFEVVDGADGTARPLGGVLTGNEPWVGGAVLPDVDGDGLDDVALLSGEGFGGRKSTVRALSSRDGAARWALTTLPDDGTPRVGRVPDLTGDGRPDVAVRVGPDGCCATTTFVDSVTGRALWTRPGYRVEPLGRHLLVHEDGGSRHTMTAYTRSGRALWSVRPAPPRRGERARYVWSDGPVGDVDGDGDVDVSYGMGAIDAEYRSVGREYAVLDGTTGRVLDRYPARVRGSGAAIDGSGPDVVTATVAGGRLRVTAWNGRTARPLWSSSYPVTDYSEQTWGAPAVTVFRGDRDRCADVVVTMRHSQLAAIGFSGSTGRATWVVDSSRDDWPVPAGGRPARRYC